MASSAAATVRRAIKRADWATFNRSVVKGIGHAVGTVLVYALVAWIIVSYLRGRDASVQDTLRQAVSIRATQGMSIAASASASADGYR